MKKITLVVMTIAGLGGAASAFASDEGFYVSGAIGVASGGTFQSYMENLSAPFSSTINSPGAIKLNVGYQVNEDFAIEGGYLGLNNQNYADSNGATATNSINGWDVKAVGLYPLGNQVSLLGKLGVADISSTVNIPGYSTGTSSTTGLTYGVGAKFNVSNGVWMRVDWDSYNSNINNGDGITPVANNRFNVWTVGVGTTF